MHMFLYLRSLNYAKMSEKKKEKMFVFTIPHSGLRLEIAFIID